MSETLLLEMNEVLGRAKFRALRQRRQVEISSQWTRIKDFAIFPERIPIIAPFIPDPKDTMILALAKAGNADFIVSGDQKLRELVEYEGIPILSPRQFLDLIQSMNEVD